MKQIYGRSIRIIIWLPIEDRAATAATTIFFEIKKYLDIMKYVLEMGEEDETTVTAKGQRQFSKTTSGDSSFPSLKDSRWGAQNSVLDSPWFERCWVVQEVALSRGTPLMLLGKQKLDWQDLSRTFSWLMKNLRTTGWYDISHPSGSLDTVRAIYQENALALDLSMLLRLLTNTHASDPRDRILALLRLARDTASLSIWPPQLEPDYSRSTRSVYTEVTRYCIRHESH